jgi:hypothetical protein
MERSGRGAVRTRTVGSSALSSRGRRSAPRDLSIVGQITQVRLCDPRRSA